MKLSFMKVEKLHLCDAFEPAAFVHGETPVEQTFYGFV